ncbi:LANO_0G16578g1_1 [Lachancea nothofagi CBS 11611]|uniref:Nuclear pore complex protein Nup85 n=1 Tax=Lachancea nothofagi CBS 11611 TaxID=1266666 RepID=A0A1G4KKS1_9SACH|nr:LANO_0G16578g1_1 [Lachancea nothofagi CBS 11611]
MSAIAWDQKNDFLMDVDGLDFLKSSSMDTTVQNEHEIEDVAVDSISGAPESYFEGEQPIRTSVESFRASGRFLKFQIAPVASRSVGYVTGVKTEEDFDVANSRLYTPTFPRLDSSEAYKQFVLTCFEIYKNLGEDRIFSVPTMGLISQSSRREHTEAVNLAMEALVDELETFAATQSFVRGSELEECLSILNCVKAVHFTKDLEDEYSQKSGLVQELTQWINRADGEPSEHVIENVFEQHGSAKVYDTSSFWHLVNQLLLRGLFEQAVGVLERSQIYSELQSQCELSFNVLTDATTLLQEYPSSGGEEFREWKAAALQLSQIYSESSSGLNPELRNFINDMILLIGGTQAKILQYSNTWYESFCGLYMFYIPTLDLSEEYLQISLDAHPVDVCNTWEQASVEVIKGKIYAVLPMLESLDFCVAVFFAAICEAKGLLESSNSLTNHQNRYEGIEGDLFSSNNSMASFLLHGFALELCSYDDKHLWSVAIGILALSPSGNDSAVRLAIAELLPHYPFQNNDDIEWLLTLCAKWRLPEIAKTIHRILGNKFLYDNNVIEAMTNFSKAGEFEWVKHYSWMIFEASAIQGSPLEDVVIDAIVSKEIDTKIPKEVLSNVLTDVMKQTLSPYAVLYQFYQQLAQQDWDGALQNLLNLLEFRYLPRHYVSLLIAKFLYPVFLQEDSRQIAEDSIMRIIKAMGNLSEDDKSTALYEVLKQRPGNEMLPAQLKELTKSVRQRLNYKICLEFMN